MNKYLLKLYINKQTKHLPRDSDKMKGFSQKHAFKIEIWLSFSTEADRKRCTLLTIKQTNKKGCKKEVQGIK